MPQRENAEQRRTGRTVETDEQAPKSAETAPSELDTDVDAILDEIDTVLEDNAEEFVRSYVQKGGE